jgi:hypothetical protein
MVPDEDTLVEVVATVRSHIKTAGAEVLAIKKSMLNTGFAGTKANGDKELEGESIANATLAFRHLEDAAMRLGKVLQALNGGVSQYDNSGVVAQK